MNLRNHLKKIFLLHPVYMLQFVQKVLSPREISKSDIVNWFTEEHLIDKTVQKIIVCILLFVYILHHCLT